MHYFCSKIRQSQKVDNLSIFCENGDMPTDALLAALLEKQKHGAMNGAEFARQMGITRSYWNHIKAGRRPVTIHVARRAAARWPEMRGFLIEHLVRAVA